MRLRPSSSARAASQSYSRRPRPQPTPMHSPGVMPPMQPPGTMQSPGTVQPGMPMMQPPGMLRQPIQQPMQQRGMMPGVTPPPRGMRLATTAKGMCVRAREGGGIPPYRAESRQKKVVSNARMVRSKDEKRTLARRAVPRTHAHAAVRRRPPRPPTNPQTELSLSCRSPAPRLMPLSPPRIPASDSTANQPVKRGDDRTTTS